MTDLGTAESLEEMMSTLFLRPGEERKRFFLCREERQKERGMKQDKLLETKWLGVGPKPNASNVFVPAVMLPEQEEARRSPAPEVLLIWAVLMDAIECLFIANRNNGQQRRTDWDWVNSDDDSPFSFVWICDMLNISPGRLHGAFVAIRDGERGEIFPTRECPGCGSRFTAPVRRPFQVFCRLRCSLRTADADLMTIAWNRSGLCACGCNNKTRLASYTSARLGWVHGKPIWYVHGHGARFQGRRSHEIRSGCFPIR